MSDKTTKETNFGFRQVDSQEKSKMVGNVFDAVSENYDLMNDLMSFGIHRLWKKVAIESSGLRADFKVLDLAGGTGDMVKLMKEKGLDDILLVGGGIIPKKDIVELESLGMGKLFGPGTPVKETIVYIDKWVQDNRR